MNDYRIIPSIALLCLLAMPIQQSVAQEAAGQDQEVVTLEEVLVTGSRVIGRSAADSPVPVDVLEGKNFTNYGVTDMNSLLRATVPSYNVSQQPISDAGTLVRPANLRGMPPDSVLILLNGKRRHRSSVITFLGTGNTQGSHAPDLASIPAIALKRVEVLRDGAAAQYGSDAVAGVMNFILNDAPDSGRIETRWGQFYQGDGDALSVAGNLGLPLPLPFIESGFANFSFDYRNVDPTVRSVQRKDAQALIDAGNSDVRQPYAGVWGQPKVHYDYKLFGNLGMKLNSSAELYAFGNYAERKVEGGFYYRNPNTRSGVFKGPQRVKGFTDGNLDGYYGTRPDGAYHGTFRNYLKENQPANYADLSDKEKKKIDKVLTMKAKDDTYDTLKVVNLDPSQGGCPIVEADDAADYSDVVLPDHCAIFNSRFPGGFTPTFGGTVRDLSAAVGIRGKVSSATVWLDNWHYDLSAVFGQHSTDFFMTNTINPQLVAKSEYDVSNIPTNYNPGSYTETDRVFNLDLSRPLDTNMFYSPLNLALGFEYRTEAFDIEAGGENAWYADKTDGGLAEQGFGVGSNGFTGFHPDAAGENDRGSYATYLDLETNVTKDVLVELAGRYEDYETFGDTLNGKASTRWQATNYMALRGSVSTGFRAPTVGQANVQNVTTEFSDGALADILTAPAASAPAQIAGAVKLKPEKSLNLSLGTVLDVGNLSVTIDYYRSKVQDRITQTKRIDLTPEERRRLTAINRQFADVSGLKFFANAFDTTTQGIDLVATYPMQMAGGENLFTLAGNWNQTEVTEYNADVVDDKKRIQWEQNLPNFRFTLSSDYRRDAWRLLARLHYYGNFTEFTTDDSDLRLNADARQLVDVEASYSFKSGIIVAAGAENLFNTFPSRTRNEFLPDGRNVSTSAGLKYAETSPFGFNGGFYYFRALYAF